MKRRCFARYNRKNPTTEDYVVAGLGIALAASLGYLLYMQGQANVTASDAPVDSGNTSTQGNFVNTGSGWLGGASVSEGAQPIAPVGVQPGESAPIPLIPFRGAPPVPA